MSSRRRTGSVVSDLQRRINEYAARAVRREEDLHELQMHSAACLSRLREQEEEIDAQRKAMDEMREEITRLAGMLARVEFRRNEYYQKNKVLERGSRNRRASPC